MPGTPSKASPKLTAFWRKVSPEMILSEAVEVCNRPEVARRTAFTDDGNLFQVNRLLGFMRLGEDGGAD